MPSAATPSRFGDDDGELLPFPINWTGCFKLRIKISHLWMMGGADKSFGFVTIREDLMPQQAAAAPPRVKTIAE